MFYLRPLNRISRRFFAVLAALSLLPNVLLARRVFDSPRDGITIVLYRKCISYWLFLWVCLVVPFLDLSSIV